MKFRFGFYFGSREQFLARAIPFESGRKDLGYEASYNLSQLTLVVNILLLQ